MHIQWHVLFVCILAREGSRLSACHDLMQGFFKGFYQLASPLTNLNKKEDLCWSEEAQRFFKKMKEVMSSCPVLARPDFTQPFVLECDASGEGMRDILMQKKHPIAFESIKL